MFTNYQLTNNVNLCWDNLKKKEKLDEKHLERGIFKKHFEDKYLGEMYYCKKEDEYYTLNKNSITEEEYK